MNFMVLRPFREANSHSASREVPHLLWDPKVHYRIHKGPTLVPIPSQMHIASNVLLSFSKIRYNFISNLLLGLQSALFPSDFPTKILHAFLISPMRATCSTHFMLLYFVTVITFDEAYKI
jgi:hypothetical protein